VKWPSRWRRLFRNPLADRDESEAIREEFAFHLDELEERFVREGMSREDARGRARAAFGDALHWHGRAHSESRRRRAAEERRDVFSGLRADVRVSLRQWSRQPLHTAVILLVLTLGIGSGATVWTVLDAHRLTPVPIEDPGEVVVVMGSNRRSPSWWVSRFAYRAWDEGQRSFSHMAVVRDAEVTLLDPFPRDIGVLRVESRFFQLTGVQPALGRAFTVDEDLPGSPDLLILSHQLWRDGFESDPDIVGREVRIEGGSATVVGVMPESFTWEAVQWDNPAPEGARRLALHNGIFRSDRGALGSAGALLPLGRLREGVTLAEARADLEAIGTRLAEAHPEEYVDEDGMWLPNVQPLRWIWTRFTAADVLLLAVATVLALLLVTVNAASLLMVRVLDRRAVLAVRASLGASRLQLVRQMLVETGLFWAVALTAGVGLAWVALPWLRAITPAGVAFTDDFTLSSRAVLGAAGLALLLWILSAALPLAEGSRVDPASVIKRVGAGVRGSSGALQRMLIVGQVALSCALLGGAAMLLRDYAELRSVSIGLDPGRTAVLYLELPGSYREPAGTVSDVGGVAAHAREWVEDDEPVYRPGDRFQNFVSGTLDRMEAVPGVEAATFVNQSPLWESAHWRGIRIAPGGGRGDDSDPWIRVKWVAPGYFETLGIEVRRGRSIDGTDVKGAEPVVVVNEPLAEHVFGDADPLGRTLPVGVSAYFPREQRRVVGVVSSVLHYGPHDPAEPVLYIPVGQIPQAWTRDQIGFAVRATFLARYRSGVDGVMAGLRQAVWAAEPTLPIRKETTLARQYSSSLAEPRYFLVLLSGFALLALFLSTAGIMATLGQHIRQRTSELGVRRAFGADTTDLLRRTLGDGALLGAQGVLAGAVVYWAVARALAVQVPGVSGFSPVLLAVVGVALIGVAGAAALPAAVRAARVDPMDALRAE
jgi:hypothetical protein